MAGFIDSHVHYPQTEIIGAYGAQLLDWLNKYTFVAEQRFADKRHARAAAQVFLKESLRNGITTSAVYCTVHPQSVDAFFEESGKLGLRMIAGKVLMDRNAPAALCDTAQRGYDESKALISKWHGRERAMYAITPRFAPSSTPEQLTAAGALKREHPDCFVQSHVSENKAEVEWAKQLFPGRRDYLDVYDHYGLLGRRAIYGHGIHLSEAELARLHETGAAIAHCPTSNFFLGSGCFDLGRAMRKERPVRVGLATDVGGGTSLSFLQTLNEAYKAAQMSGYSLSAGHAFYLATRGTAQAPLPRGHDRQPRAGDGGGPRGARPEVDAADRVPDEARRGSRRGAVHPDDARRRPRGAGDVRRRKARVRPAGAAIRLEAGRLRDQLITINDLTREKSRSCVTSASALMAMALAT